MISVSDLHFSYREREILKGVSFSLRKGEMTALLGCNGCGKTTLLRCLLGLLRGYTGKIELDGRDLKSCSPSELSAKIAYIPQSHFPVFRYSVLDMVLMGTTRQTGLLSAPKAEQIRAAEEAMDKLGISSMRERSFPQLSGGERQLVLIARALAQQTPILLMDEPCSALDFGNQCMVMNAMKQLKNDGYSILMSTHNPQQVLNCFDRVLALDQGLLFADGSPGDILTSSFTERVYGVPTAMLDTPYGKVIVAKTE